MTLGNYAYYQVRLLTLSPVHIGTGRELLLNYDYAVANRQTWRLNEDETLQPHYSDDPAQIARLAQTPPAKLLSPADFQVGSKFFRYVIKGQPRAEADGSILRDQIKTVDDQLYVPGSSLKGALRTVLAWHGWQATHQRPDRLMLDERRAKFAAKRYEQAIFGNNPNNDLLRALQVSDSDSIAATNNLILVNAKVLKAREEGSPIELEAIAPEKTFRLNIKFDRQLFSAWAQQSREFRPGGSPEWLENLVTIARAHAAERISAQKAWFAARANGVEIANFYTKLESLQLNAGQFLIQLGWGGGWDSKTLGTRLTSDTGFMDNIIAQYRMAKGRRNAGDPFPKSRRAEMTVTRGRNDKVVETAARPLGWVLVTLGPVGDATAEWNALAEATLGKLKPLLDQPLPRPTAPPPIGPASKEKEQPSRPAQPAPRPKPAPEARPLIASFTEPPKAGDRFKGQVYSVQGRELELLIPGLDDTAAYAAITAKDNDSSKKFKESDMVVCEVIEVMQEKSGLWRVRCRRG